MLSVTQKLDCQCNQLSGGVSRYPALGNLLFPEAERRTQTLLAAWADTTKRESKRRSERECVAVRGAYIGHVHRQWTILGLRVTDLIRPKAPVSLWASAILRLPVFVSNHTGKTLSTLSLIFIFKSLNFPRFEVCYEHLSHSSEQLCLSLSPSVCIYLHIFVFVCDHMPVCVPPLVFVWQRFNSTWPTLPPAPPPFQGARPESW